MWGQYWPATAPAVHPAAAGYHPQMPPSSIVPSAAPTPLPMTVSTIPFAAAQAQYYHPYAGAAYATQPAAHITFIGGVPQAAGSGALSYIGGAGGSGGGAGGDVGREVGREVGKAVSAALGAAPKEEGGDAKRHLNAAIADTARCAPPAPRPPPPAPTPAITDEEAAMLRSAKTAAEEELKRERERRETAERTAQRLLHDAYEQQQDPPPAPQQQQQPPHAPQQQQPPPPAPQQQLPPPATQQLKGGGHWAGGKVGGKGGKHAPPSFVGGPVWSTEHSKGGPPLSPPPPMHPTKQYPPHQSPPPPKTYGQHPPQPHAQQYAKAPAG
eukprot:gene25787-55901_t